MPTQALGGGTISRQGISAPVSDLPLSRIVGFPSACHSTKKKKKVLGSSDNTLGTVWENKQSTWKFPLLDQVE